MVSLAKSWSLIDLFDKEAEDYLDFAISKHTERFHQVEPSVLSFVNEKNRLERIARETTLLRNKFNNKEKPALYGVPIAVKDLFHVDGLPTFAGSQLPSSDLTETEGSFIRLLRDQGAWIAGKTVTEEFAFAGDISTRNPHALNHSPGGSSAGSAASVASGICPIAIGTQTLRSITAPASFCGITGYKPSYGRIPMEGVILLSPSFDTAGIFTVDVLSMKFAASNLIPNWNSYSESNHYSAEETKPVLGIPNGIYMKLMGEDVRLAFEKQVAFLRQSGYTIRNVDMPWDDDFIYGDAMLRFVQGEMAQVHEEWFDVHKTKYGNAVQQAIMTGMSISEDELEQYRNGQISLRNKLAEARRTQGIDIWISPAQGGVAPLKGSGTGWPGMTAVWTYAGLPTISLPGLHVDKLPIGFQCIAEYGQDEMLLHLAQHLATFL